NLRFRPKSPPAACVAGNGGGRSLRANEASCRGLVGRVGADRRGEGRGRIAATPQRPAAEGGVAWTERTSVLPPSRTFACAVRHSARPTCWPSCKPPGP